MSQKKIDFTEVAILVFFNCGKCNKKPLDQCCDSCRLAYSYALDMMHIQIPSRVVLPPGFYEANVSCGPVPLFAVLCFYHGVVNKLLETFVDEKVKVEKADLFAVHLTRLFEQRYVVSDEVELVNLFEQVIFAGLALLSAKNPQDVLSKYEQLSSKYLTTAIVEFTVSRCNNDNLVKANNMNANWNMNQAEMKMEDKKRQAEESNNVERLALLLTDIQLDRKVPH